MLQVVHSQTVSELELRIQRQLVLVHLLQRATLRLALTLQTGTELVLPIQRQPVPVDSFQMGIQKGMLLVLHSQRVWEMELPIQKEPVPVELSH
jgi:hypothetical protein